MAKLTIIGDPHVKNKNLDQITKLFDVIEELGNPTLLTGDVFDTKEVIRGKCLNLVYERLSNSKLHFIILVGNHDYFNLECEDHSLRVFENLENVTIVDKLHEEFGCHFIPYMHDQDKLKKVLKTIPKDSVLFGHLDVVSFDYGNGYLSEAGLALKDLKKFKKVISGHYHKYQEKDNLTYIGTPFSHSFGESNQDKFIGIFDTITYEVELIKTPFLIRVIYSGSQENIIKAKAKYTFPEGTKIIERPTDEYMNNVSIDETADNFVKFKEWAEEIRGLDPETTQLGVDILEAIK